MRPFPPYPKLLEVNTRVWLKRCVSAGKPATLDQVPSAFRDSIADPGIRLVWLMGVWKTPASLIEKYCLAPHLIAAYRRALPDWTKEDVIGSPYAIDAYECSPALGGPEALDRLREQLGRRGIRLILDCIPNHFGGASGLLRSNPGLFLSGNESLARTDPATYFQAEEGSRISAHGRDPYFPAGPDTAQVNLADPSARRFMVNRLLEVAAQCDGVRCDMAMLALNEVFAGTWNAALAASGYEAPAEEFWPRAISEVKARFPDFLFIGEAYWDKETVLLEQGFDYAYDKAFTDILKNSDAQEVRRHLAVSEGHQGRMTRFLENHDEERAVSAFGRARSLAAAVIMTTVPGLRLYFIMMGSLREKRCVSRCSWAESRASRSIGRSKHFTKGFWKSRETRPSKRDGGGCWRGIPEQHRALPLQTCWPGPGRMRTEHGWWSLIIPGYAPAAPCG